MRRIVQLTDCHLFADPTTALREIVTWPRFTSVLQSIRRQVPELDLLVITGDIAHDEVPATYDAVVGELRDWSNKVRVVPGNHDLRAALGERFAGSTNPCAGRVTFHQQWEDWQVIGLDSKRPGDVSGALGEDQLSWLRERLEVTKQLDTLLFMHHPPISVHSPWLDRIGLEDAAQLEPVLNDFPQVRLIGCGHVHHEVVAKFGPATVFTTPAVGPRFRPRTEQLVIDEGPPGFRLWELLPEGRWSTQVLQGLPITE